MTEQPAHNAPSSASATNDAIAAPGASTVASTPDPPRPQRNSVRYHGLDALRGVAMMLGIVLHAALLYVFAEEGYGEFWPQDDQQSDLGWFVFSFIHTWRMPTFFLLAGFFAHLVLDRRGDAYFVRDRLQRILLPLAIFGTIMILILPTIWVTASVREFTFVTPFDLEPGELSFGHLWFIYHLVYLYAILMAARWIAGAVRWPSGPGRIMLGAFVNRWHVPLVLLLAIVWLGRYAEEADDTAIWPIGTFDFIYSLVPFAIGYALYKRREIIARLAEWNAIIPALALATVGYVVQETFQRTELDGTTLAESIWPVYLLGKAIATVGYTFGIIGLFQRLFTSDSTVVRWVADASYWVYIMHLPVVLIIGATMFELPWPAEIKFLIVCTATAALGFASYWAFVRYTPIGTLLNGKRIRGQVGRVHAPQTRTDHAATAASSTDDASATDDAARSGITPAAAPRPLTEPE